MTGFPDEKTGLLTYHQFQILLAQVETGMKEILLLPKFAKPLGYGQDKRSLEKSRKYRESKSNICLLCRDVVAKD